MKKRLVSLVLALVMIMSMTLPAYAAENVWDETDFTFAENEDGTVTITGLSESGVAARAEDPNMVLPNAIDGKDVTAIAAATAGGNGLFASETEALGVVTLPEKLTTIGNFAFQNSGVTAITFPETLTSIGMAAFQQCLMEEVVLPDSIGNSIGNGAFAALANLKTVKLPGTMTEIPASIFVNNNGNPNFTSVEIPSGVTMIGSSAFAGNNFSKIVVPESVKEIGSSAFAQSGITSNLTEVVLSEGLESIGNTAFKNSKLSAVTLPTTVTSIHKNAFRYCNGVVSLYVSDEAQYETLSATATTHHKLVFIGGRQYKTGAEALAAVEAGTGVVLDVRANERRADLQLAGSLHQPLFTVTETGSNKVSNLNDTLSADFLTYVTGNADLAGKDIYILCNSGASGAEAATKLLLTAGYPMSQIITITNGAKDLDIVRASVVRENPLDASVALDVINNPAEHPDEVVIDVRAAERYAVGHLKGTKNLPLFTVNAETDKNVPTTLDDELSTAFTTYVKDNAETLKGKDIYVLCNSGQSGAKNAAKLLYLAGYNLDNVHTITGGAAGEVIKPALKFVSDEQAISVVNDENYVIVDVRAKERYEAGHIEGSISLPLFTVDPETGKNVPVKAPYEDELSQAFLEYVEANPDTFANKTVYILCNSGQTGVANALALFEMTGYTDNIFGIDGGATNESIQAIFVVDEKDDVVTDDEKDDVVADDEKDDVVTDDEKDNVASDNEKDDENAAADTGDTSNVLSFALVMMVALCAVVVNEKKRANN